MDANQIVQAISTLGFPICMCGAMFWYINKQTESHKEESAKTVEAINRLELQITKLLATIVASKGVDTDA